MKSKAFSLLKKLITHELIAGSFLMFIGSFVNNIFSFLFNLFLVRKFSTSDYGIYASLLSLISLSSFFSQALVTVLVKFAGDLFARQENDIAPFFYKKFLLIMFIFSISFSLVMVIFAPYIKSFLHLENYLYIYVVTAITFISYIAIVNDAFLRSLLKFKYLSFLISFGSLLKLMGGGFLVVLGYKILGALGGIFLNHSIPFILSFIPLRFLLFKKGKTKENFSIREILRYAIPASITILSLVSFISTDIILVKHFFDSSSAGLYGGLSLIGKVIFYFTSPIPLVMFPLIIKRFHGGKRFHSLFYLSLLLVSVSSILIIFLYSFFPNLVINVFLGRPIYLSVSSYLGLFGFFIFLYSLANVCINFFLSIGDTDIYKFVLFFAVLQVVFINLFHSNFLEIILGSIISIGLLLFILLIYYYRKFYGIYHPKK